MEKKTFIPFFERALRRTLFLKVELEGPFIERVSKKVK